MESDRLNRVSVRVLVRWNICLDGKVVKSYSKNYFRKVNLSKNKLKRVNWFLSENIRNDIILGLAPFSDFLDLI